MATDAILIFDVGKTNKKILVYDTEYKLIEEESIHIEETVDEEQFPCEDVVKLTQWIETSFAKAISRPDFKIKAVNFSGYGASFVCVNEKLAPVMALSNYLKPYPERMQDELHAHYGGRSLFSKVCASPPLGSLNSGLQLYRLRQEKPDVFGKIRWALHLPQYLSSVLTRKAYSEMTSIGCHTCLWDFSKQTYHRWVFDETIDTILPPIANRDQIETLEINNRKLVVGVGLHDSSAALIPYLTSFGTPFILLSTGTWNICLNPFNQLPLTEKELEQDCLCYLSYEGKRVKASRLFAGHEHEMKVKELARTYHVNENFFLDLRLDSSGKLSSEESVAIAYLDYMKELVKAQINSIELVQGPEHCNQIFVDGGFSKNNVFMQLLAQRYPSIQILAATVPQASALGAAMAIHHRWNDKPIPTHLIDLKKIDRITSR